MEADIEYLMTKKIRDVLDLCGIKEYSHQAIQQHAVTMAQFVLDARLQADMGASARPSAYGVSETRKRGPADDETEGPVPKKEKVWKERSSSFDDDADSAPYANYEKRRERGPEDDETDKTVFEEERMGKERYPSVGYAYTESSRASDEWPVLNESAYGTEPRTCESAERERLVTDQCCASPSWGHLDFNTPRTPLSSGSASLVHRPPCLTSPVLCTTCSTFPMRRSTCPASPVCCPIRSPTVRGDTARASLDPSLPTMPDWHLSQMEKQVIESILVDCVVLQRKLGMSSQGSQRATVGKIVEGTQTLAQSISELDYEGAIQAVQKDFEIENDGLLRRCIEARYWDIILRGAKLLDPQKLPLSRGRLDGFSGAQKEATRLFMAEMGIETTLLKQRKCRILWKTLYDMRNAGVDKILLYRTRRFDNFCRGPRNDAEMSPVEMALRWEQVFGPQIDQLEARVVEECEGGLTGGSWLQQSFVADRVHLAPTSWNNASNPWHSRVEEGIYGYLSESAETSNCHRIGSSEIIAAGDVPFNKSIFVTLLPRDETSLLVCPIVTIHEGDFLGVFSGEIRCSEQFDDRHGIRGSRENIWLDYSRVSGPLNMMGVTMSGDEANVDIFWEGYCEDDGSPAWRVWVRALRTIEPFEELTRATTQAEQARLHQDPESARRGFTRSSRREDSSAWTV